MVAGKPTMVRFPDKDLFQKVRVLAYVNGEPVGAVLARLARGAVQAEFSQLPEAAQQRIGKRFRLTPTGRPPRKTDAEPPGQPRE
jgi:hypothetical protein